MELDAYEGVIRGLVLRGWSYRDISSHLRQITGQDRRLSPRSVGQFCTSRNIHNRSGLNNLCLDRVVCDFVAWVGHAYGRRTMHGLLHSQGLRVSQRRLAASMQRVAPLQYAARHHIANLSLNPLPYYAHSFGDKLHLDQNEKCAMFGVTHILAIDGYSRKIVGFITIPKKNSMMVYDLLFRPLLLSRIMATSSC